jgi:hypothetical protein
MEHGAHSILNLAISALEDQHSSVRGTAMGVLSAHLPGHHDHRGEAEPHAGAEAGGARRRLRSGRRTRSAARR